MKPLCCLKESGTDNPVTRRHVQKNGVLSYSFLKTVELTASRSTACTDISVTALWLSIPHSCLNQFSHYSCPIWQTLFFFCWYVLVKKQWNLRVSLLLQDR